jgi:long-chain acyl-CoA synthetase
MEINLNELEAYYGRSPCIKEICIFIEEMGRGQDKLSGVILPDLDYLSRKGISQIKDRIRYEIDSLSRNLPEDKRIKRSVIVSDRLPRAADGRIDRLEIKKKYSESSPVSEERPGLSKPSSEDASLLSSPSCCAAMEYLAQKLKRPVGLDEHLELDLGLDSLERISLLFEFQKLSGFQLDESQFFFVSTVRDVLDKLRSLSGAVAEKEEAFDWDRVLTTFPDKELGKKDITLTQGALTKIANLFFYLLLKVVSRLLFCLTVKGRENIPPQGPFIFCPNHSSYLDVPLFAASLDFHTVLRTHFLGYRAYIEHRLLRWAKKLFRLIPVEPSERLSDTLMMCAFVLKNSRALCIFPEGARSVDGKIKEFKRGAGILIKELNIDVVPVYIRGAHKAWPAYRAFPLPGKIEVIFGRKLVPQELMARRLDGLDIYQNIVHNLREKMLKIKDSYGP